MSIIFQPTKFDPKTVRPDFAFERAVMSAGSVRVGGIDEVGRGPLSGPVLAAAVVLDIGNVPAGLNDSKKLGPARRRKLFHEIVRTSQVGVGIVSAREIDRINILQATFLAMSRAAGNLPGGADFWLVDGDKVPPVLAGSSAAVVKGDARSLSIAAASIVAKVMRDRIMELADMRWPQYGFAKHAGYGTQFHRDALRAHGPCPIHRMSFSPVSEIAGRP